MVFDIFSSNDNNFDSKDNSTALGKYLEREYPRKFTDGKTEINITRTGETEYEFTIKDHIPAKKSTDTYEGKAELTESGWNAEITDRDINF